MNTPLTTDHLELSSKDYMPLCALMTTTLATAAIIMKLSKTAPGTDTSINGGLSMAGRYYKTMR